jgi:hypothetical protein
MVSVSVSVMVMVMVMVVAHGEEADVHDMRAVAAVAPARGPSDDARAVEQTHQTVIASRRYVALV